MTARSPRRPPRPGRSGSRKKRRAGPNPRLPRRPIPVLPAELAVDADSLSLEQVVDLALRNNPETRASWSASLAAAARLGQERSAYYPRLDLTADAGRTRGSAAAGRIPYQQVTFGPEVILNLLLFDFGQREALVESARQELHARNWTHNSTVQNVVLQVELAYYNYLYAKSLRQALEVSVGEAKANLEAAEFRHRAGLATRADILQARTNYSQSLLSFQEVEGQVQTIRGALATAMGLPANLDYDVGLLPRELPVQLVAKQLDQLLTEAERLRPDLAAARSRVLEAEAELSAARARRYPGFSLNAALGRDYYNSRDRYGDNRRASIALAVPLFTGFDHQQAVIAAESGAEEARARAESLRNRVVLDVWTAYYDLQTSARRMETSRDLLESATENHTVAQERYRAGVGSILELLAAQSTLAEARAQEVQARTSWLMSLAQLAHDSGALWLSGPETGADGRKINEEEEQ